MYTVIGTLLFAVAVTLFTWSAVQYRQPVLAHWTSNTSTSMALALTCVVSLLLSSAFISQAIFAVAPAMPLTVPVVVSAAAVILGIGAFVMRRLILQWRHLIRSQAGFAANFSAANDSNPNGRTPVSGSPNGTRPRRRKAA